MRILLGLALLRLQLVLRDILGFHGLDQFFADAHNIRREVCPFDLRVIQRLLSVLLLALIVDQGLLHLREPIRHLIVLAGRCDGRVTWDRESVGLLLTEHEEEAAWLLS